MRTVAISLSGGLDSAVLLAQLLREDADPPVEHVHAVTINYGQRHQQEIRSACELAAHYMLPERPRLRHHLVPLHGLGVYLGGSALTDRKIPVPEGHYEDASMRSTVVPNRNMILLAVAGGIAVANGCDTLVYAAHSGDHAIYPDCRPAFINAMTLAFYEGTYENLVLHAPFEGIDKAGIIKLGIQLAVPFELTWTCYVGDKDPCGKCGACVERAEAFEANGILDPALP